MVVRGVNVSRLSPKDAIGWIQSIDPGASEDADGITSVMLGLSLWITVSQSNVDTDICAIESVLVFSSEYGTSP
jgi:hypothetical protein